MKTNCLFICIAFCAVCAGSLGVARDFGPEWTRVSDGFRKELKVPVHNFGLGGGSGYDVQLESLRVQIVENDDYKGFSLQVGPYGYFEVRRNADGTAASHRILFPILGAPKVQYWDLNGDGVFDLMLDSRGPTDRKSILLDDRFVLVWGSRAGSETRTAYSPDRQIEYVFENEKWRIKK
jgi:hypothetical protein